MNLVLLRCLGLFCVPWGQVATGCHSFTLIEACQMAKRQRTLTLDDLRDMERLRGWIGRGLVTVTVDDADADEQRVVRIMNYVSGIAAQASEKDRPYIKEVWNRLLHDELFAGEFRTKKCDSTAPFNKTMIMRVVGVMYERELYVCRTKTELHDRLENTHARTAYHSYLSKGLSQKLFNRFLRLVKEVREEYQKEISKK